MKKFDVMVFNQNENREMAFRTQLSKREAKELVEILKGKGAKARFITSKCENFEELSIEEVVFEQEDKEFLEKN